MSVRRAFTLVEVMIALAILAGLVFTSTMALRTNQVKRQSKAAAEVLAAALRLANLRARAQGFPVAVAIPTDIGKTPLARGYYMVEGEVVPAKKRGYDFGAEMPDALLYSGLYPGPSWQDPPALASRGSKFDFEEWYPPYPSDAYFVFLPSGEVIANRSAAGSEYRIVVGTRVTSTAPPEVGINATASRPAEANLTAVADPYTITISTQGLVEVVPGLKEAPAGVVQSTLTMPGPDRVAFTPPMYTGPNRAPELVPPKMIMNPVQNQDLLDVLAPPGIKPSAGVLPDKSLTVTFYAQDKDGDQLTAEWTSEGPKGPGNWTTPISRMRWSYAVHAWYRSSTWTPPVDSLPGEVYKLRCRILDGHGGELKPNAAAVIGYPGATADGFDTTILSPLRIGLLPAGGGLNVTNLDGSYPSAVLTAAQLGSQSPSFISWYNPGDGFLFAGAGTPVAPRWLDNLDGSLPTAVGNDTKFSASASQTLGMVVAGTQLYGLVKDGSNAVVVNMTAPPTSANLTVGTVATRPEEGFRGLLAVNTERTLLSSNGTGKFLVVQVAPTLASSVVSGPSLRNPANRGNILYGEQGGSIVAVPITVSGTSVTFGTATVVAESSGCTNPSLSPPDGRFMICRNPVGATSGIRLFNLDSGEANDIPGVPAATEIVWSRN